MIEVCVGEVLTVDRLRDRLDYNPDTGVFKWKKPFPKNMRKDGTAGYSGRDGVIQIEIDGKAYLAHRLVFLLEDGVFPKNLVDHRDGVRNNNRRINLRKATSCQNNQNAKIRIDNKTGIKGVFFNKSNGKYRVVINFQKKAYHLGYYEDLDAANQNATTFRNRLHDNFARHL